MKFLQPSSHVTMYMLKREVKANCKHKPHCPSRCRLPPNKLFLETLLFNTCYDFRKKILEYFPCDALLLNWFCIPFTCSKRNFVMFLIWRHIKLDFPGDWVVKSLPANAGDTRDVSWSLGWEDPLEEKMATQASIPAWKKFINRGA